VNRPNFRFQRVVASVTCAIVLCTSLLRPLPARAQTHADIVAAAANSCAVMAGTQKADSRTLQYLLLLDEDMGEANPVALALYHQVVTECPKAYLGYEQRKRASNPFPPGYLTSGKTTSLTGPGAALTTTAAPRDYPVRCRGARGMASYANVDVAVVFKHATRPAGPDLEPGRCAWVDRAFRPNEPTRIVVRLPSEDVARRVAVDVNAGHTWTFWAFLQGATLRADSLAQGTPAHKR
jgi:hypothetical protein